LFITPKICSLKPAPAPKPFDLDQSFEPGARNRRPTEKPTYRDVVLTVIAVLLVCIIYFQCELSGKATVMTWRLEDILLHVKYGLPDLSRYPQ